jgi:hypothetical protein
MRELQKSYEARLVLLAALFWAYEELVASLEWLTTSKGLRSDATWQHTLNNLKPAPHHGARL